MREDSIEVESERKIEGGEMERDKQADGVVSERVMWWAFYWI